ncbi:MAG TPA: FIST N-terminal domain-containing protein [Dissulfurispiraceae bacterium]|nr:FIST N-terminal domain-containing protein [Dissulfurispiraceae bacterium]
MVGVSQHVESVEAGRSAARMALEKSGGAVPGWAIAFCGGHYDPDKVLEGLRSELGDVEIVGGAAIGTVTNQLLGYTGFECAVAVFPSPMEKPRFITVEGLDRGTLEAGRELGTRLRESVNGDGKATALIFYDSIQSSPPPVLHVGSRLIDGIYRGLDGKNVELVGAGTVANFQMMDSYIFTGKGRAKHSAVAAILPSSLECHTTIMHGCIPVSSFLEITRIEGPIVYELDGKPALDVIRNIIGSSLSADQPSLTVTLGQKYGDPFAPYDESAYINRLIISGNPNDGSVVLFEADFEVGAKVQVMSRDNMTMLESVRRRTAGLLSSLGTRKPVMALYIDCAGRSCAFSGADIEEASLVQAAMGDNIPMLGFYSGVEIAPLLGMSRPLDWTGVLSILTTSG